MYYPYIPFVTGLTILFALIIFPGDCPINESDYKRLPALAHFEDFDTCFESQATYCLAYSYIKPNTSSELWHYIEEMSNNKYHYRHDMVKRGVCLKNCRTKTRQSKMFEINKPFPLRVKDERGFEIMDSEAKMVRSCLGEIGGLEAFSIANICVNQESEKFRKGEL